MVGDTNADGVAYNPASGDVNGIAVASDFQLIPQSQNYGGAMIRGSGTGPNWYSYGYGWILGNNTNLLIYDGGAFLASVAFSVTLGAWYNQEMLAPSDNSMQVRIWPKGTVRPSSPSLSVAAITPSANDGTGVRMIGAGNLGVNHAYYVNFRVRKYAPPEPATSVGGEVAAPAASADLFLLFE